MWREFKFSRGTARQNVVSFSLDLFYLLGGVTSVICYVRVRAALLFLFLLLASLPAVLCIHKRLL